MSANPFDDFISFITQKHGEENWVTVYKSIPINEKNEDGGMYCALVSSEKARKALRQPDWDLLIGTGGPGFCTSYENGTKTIRYCAKTDEDPLRLVLNRDFYGKKNNYTEITEEFRLFHNLYYQHSTSSYIAFDDEGDEVDVIIMTDNEVKIRKSYLRAFMAAKQMHLLLYFELTRHFQHLTGFNAEEKNESTNFIIYSGSSYANGYTSFVRILGKKIIKCDAIENCGVWPFEKKKKYQEFIIGGDDNEPEMFTCDPALLSNYFVDKSGASHYLTPVFFRKEVMQKYYSASDYEVSDGILSRRGSWSLRLDNNSPHHVSVFLGDLGRDLPAKEQIYWKSFNIAPDGRKISTTNFQRNFMGSFFDPESPEHIFKNKYTLLQNSWKEKYGWNLFLKLSKKDEHFFTSIHSMLKNEQSEFDAQILAITKVIIDSINVKEIRKLLGITDSEIKSIALIEALLATINAIDAAKHTTLLRGIQSVRSTGVAHRKGTEYDKAIARLDINENNYRAEFDQILLGIVELFEALTPSMPR
ncbi:MAG TPA: hypothetical protein DEV75_13530 [Desulfovibrio sp.]|jgi:hypothetical protein|nr:hypothetical protein [Desulfovibrio sp.]